MESAAYMRPPVRVVNIRKLGTWNLKEWLLNKNHIYIGRNLERYVDNAKPADNKWGNPYQLSEYTREESLQKYEAYARATLMDQIEELSGKTLTCWCQPEACHGHILIKLFKEKHCPAKVHIRHDGLDRIDHGWET